MPIWQPTLNDPHGPGTTVSDRSLLDICAGEHRSIYGTDPHGAAVAPSTWTLIGEDTDRFGGIVVSSTAQWAVAVTVSPSAEPHYTVAVQGAEGVEKHSIGVEELNTHAAHRAHFPEDTPPTVLEGPAARLGAVVWTMVHRQLLSRDTRGMDITVVSTIPADIGLGENTAMEVAIALALFPEDNDEAPVRARLAEICAQSADLITTSGVIRAGYTTALRGDTGKMAVIDYADGSVNQAPHPVGPSAGLAAFVLAPPHSPGSDVAGPDTAGSRERELFIDEACRAFSVDSLRLLPDATPRVLDWLEAVLEVTDRSDLPTMAQARRWLDFWEAETRRARQVSHALRARRRPEISRLLADSQEEIGKVNAIASTTAALVDLSRSRGSLSARSCADGTAVFVLVEQEHADNFATDLAADGILVVPLCHGQAASGGVYRANPHR